MKASIQDSMKLKEFFEGNRKKFEEELLSEAVNVKDKINEILTIGNIDLVNNANKIVGYIIDGNVKELQLFAKQEGIAWAIHSIELSFKLEWVQAIRRTVWGFIEQYNQLIEETMASNFFRLEEHINTQIDLFLNTFFINYSTYKDSLIKAHREMVEALSVPIIPINGQVSILPLIGSMDEIRTSIIEEKVLNEIGISRIQTLIMDLSGIGDMEPKIINHLVRIIDGTSLMGCNTVITGLRPEVVRKMINISHSFDSKTTTFGTLQQALKKYLLH
ncbi:STAS domain-containing protein [Halalkalibacterium ligniniphilum]|uniref:STAS domain-containing protein n=1 Tax=Halalkalibacterium ligniniphilum TaxID=1134413 RepID=UPI0003487023|nr:STAS domain-containing protein [Halalkalibacterium ligniniphilum]